jgi:hypothetical protein
MQWTEDKPEQPGFYWYQGAYNEPVQLVRLAEDKTTVLTVGSAILWYIGSMFGSWQGPVTPENRSNLSVPEIQQKFYQAGYQWIEHIFNDGNSYNDCYIRITKHTCPLALGRYESGEVGWGRFGREYCWREAYQWLLTQDKEDEDGDG